MRPTRPDPAAAVPSEGRRVVLAAVAGAHGVGGEVRLKLFADSLASLKRHATFDTGGRTLTLTSVRDGSTGPVARFAEIADRTAAEALRGVELSVPRAALPAAGDGEVYVVDLIGLPARTPDGGEAGRIAAVENFGAGDLVEIVRADESRVLVPFARCELGNGHLIVDPAFLD